MGDRRNSSVRMRRSDERRWMQSTAKDKVLRCMHYSQNPIQPVLLRHSRSRWAPETRACEILRSSRMSVWVFIVRKIPWIMHFFPLQFEIFSHVYALRMISHNSHFPLFSADEFWFCHCIIASQKILNNRCNHEHWRSKIRCDIGHRLLQEACIIKWIYALWYCMPHSYVAEQMGIRNASQRTDIDC